MATQTSTEPRDAKAPNGSVSGRVDRRRPRSKTTWRQAIRKDWRLYSFIVLPLIFLLVFRYVPMLGNVIAFRRYRPGGNIFGDEWVGLHYVRMFINDPTFWNVFRNTMILGVLTIVIVFPLPIILALMLNEVRSRRFKRLVQTVSYLPHFMSLVIVAGIVFQLTALNGTINQLLDAIGMDKISFMQEASWFRQVFIGAEIWMTVGWGTILYLAALTTVDEQLYEAARIDGAGRLRQTWHVTLPGIRHVMVVLLVLNIGIFMSQQFERVLLLYNPLLYPTADVITTYVFRVGIQTGSYSYAAAIGLFEALIGLFLVLSANAISRRTVGSSLW
jgi:putative aldouronate transport system permease protein